ncbi:solute carrier family 23 member 2 isoform X2 [Brevipalpus obovatus]
MCTYGIRLPIVQGIAFYFLTPVLTMFEGIGEECPKLLDNSSITEFLESPEYQLAWTTRMRIVQGALFMGAILEIIIGLSGIVGIMMRYFTPLTIGPLVIQLGITLGPVANKKASENILVCTLTILLIIIFSQYLSGIYIPIPVPRRTAGQKRYKKVYAFKMFGILLSIFLMWIFSYIATIFDWFPAKDPGRSDAIDPKLLRNSNWFRIPYPFQWGLPIVTFNGFLSMATAQITSVVDSLGDYLACSTITQSPKPPIPVINRAIFSEALGCLAGSIWGAGAGLTSFSSNIAAISVTRAGSIRVIQAFSILMMILSVCGKVSGFFVLIPSPILAGVFIVMIGIMTAVGFSLLKDIDMTSPRNLFILGVSLMCGASLPDYFKDVNNPTITGNSLFDSTLKTILNSGSLVSGLIGFILDNTIPGSLAERGLESKSLEELHNISESKLSSRQFSQYKLPFNLDYSIGRFFKFLPIFLHLEEDKNENFAEEEPKLLPVVDATECKNDSNFVELIS